MKSTHCYHRSSDRSYHHISNKKLSKKIDLIGSQKP